MLLGPVQTPLFSWAEPNTLNYPPKYMESLASESIRNTYFNLERLSRFFLRLAQSGTLTMEQLWNVFDLDTKLFMYQKPNA